MSQEISGACLCGSIRYTVTGPFDRFYFCYCSRCRKATGTAHASNIFTTPDRIKWLSGKDNVRRFELPEAERFCKTFCKECGSAVPGVSRDGKMLMIPAGGLESDPGIRPQAGIFWMDRAAWYDDGLTAHHYDTYPS
jgi:hypothetical protein